jgi:SAM-dependent methyltransferase
MAHWTEELFEKNPELFVGVFELRMERAPREVDILLGSLGEQGFEPKRVLDLNCGVGRHALELGKRGIEVVGTDISPSYIEIASDKAEKERVADKVRFQVADMRKIASVLSGEKPFDGVINLWTAFGFYDDETNDDILRQCLGLVRPGGFFAMDIANRDWIVLNFQRNGFQKMGDRIVLEERELNLNDSRMYNVWTYLKQETENTYTLEKTINVDHRVWSLHELAELFEKTGWRFKAAYPGLFPGDTPRGPGQRVDLMRSRMLLVISYRPESE